jgi:hypothetical protein
MEETIRQKYAEGDIPKRTTTVEHVLVKEDVGWRVFADFKGKQERAARDELIAEMLRDANQLKREKEYARAVELYSAVLGEDASNADAIKRLKETEQEIAQAKLKQEQEIAEAKVKRDYIARVMLFDFEATRIDTWREKNVAAVRFALKNGGDRTLNKVEVTVYFKDADGGVIFEENYHPVLVSKYSIGDAKPLKPNYVWRQGEGKYYTIANLGPEWKTGAAQAIITDVEFAP